MTRSDYLEFFKTTTENMLEITKRKNKDYAGDGDPFANFCVVESVGIASVEQGFLTRMCDKLSRITNITKSGQTHVKDESVTDTLIDLANYSILMAAYLKSKNVGESNEI